MTKKVIIGREVYTIQKVAAFDMLKIGNKFMKEESLDMETFMEVIDKGCVSISPIQAGKLPYGEAMKLVEEIINWSVEV